MRLPPLLRPGPAFQTSLTAAAVSVAAAGARAGRGAVLSTHALRLRVPGPVASPPKSPGGSRGVHRRCQSSALTRNLDFAAGRRSVPCGVRRRSRARERADGARPRAGGGRTGGCPRIRRGPRCPGDREVPLTSHAGAPDEWAPTDLRAALS